MVEPSTSLAAPGRVAASLLLLVGAVVGAANSASAEARISVKGDTLRGRIVDLTPAGVTFDPIHGEGKIVVPWSDVEHVESDDPVTVMHGADGDAYGRVLGVEDGRVLIGASRSEARRIPTDVLFHAYPDDFGETFFERMQSRYRHWTANFDVGAAYTDSTTDLASGYAALRLDREEGPTRFFLEGDARYANQKESGEDRSVTENRLYGFTRGEVDVTDRFYNYASFRATHDQIQNLSVRLEPRAGLGVHVVKSVDFNFSTDVGLTWIYEDYYGDEFIVPGQPLETGRGHDNHWAVAFGAQANAKLPYGATWRARAEYLPAVDDWERDYLMRLETAIDFPLLEWLSFTVGLRDEYDNTPAPGTERNSLTTHAGLSFRFP